MNKNNKSNLAFVIIRKYKKYYKIKILIVLLIYLPIIFLSSLDNNDGISNFRIELSLEKKLKDYLIKNFSIIRRIECPTCGFFSYYIVYAGCIYKFLSEGYIPIVDLQSFNNIYNYGNRTIKNPWELFFYQPFNYTLEEVKLYAKNVKYLNCTYRFYRPNELDIYYNKKINTFWHNFAVKYIPIKNELNYEVEIIMKNLFHGSKNILGVILRGTDYLSLKPKYHAIPPKVERAISDVKKMDKKYKYDFIFFSTEDESIKTKFCPSFGNKLKYLNTNFIIKYDYRNKSLLNLNENIIGNLNFTKSYVLNIIILSKCLDIVAARCSGASAIFIITNGFRHAKIYNLGLYYIYF